MNSILLLHGALGSRTQLEPLKNILEDHGHQVFSMNFSGHSGQPYAEQGFGIDVFAHDVVHFIQAHHLNQITIFGYSMGGYVALWVAYQHPGLIDKIVTLGTKFDWSPDSAEREIKKLNPEKIVQKIPAFARLLEHRHSPNDWRELIVKTAAMMHGLGENPLLTQEHLRQLQIPITILLGDQDDMADRNYSRQVAGWLPQGNFQLLDSTPHPIEKVRLNELLTFI